MSAKYEIDTSAISTSILPEDIIDAADGLAAYVADDFKNMMIKRLNDVLANPINLPEGVTEEEYAKKLIKSLKSITYYEDREKDPDSVMSMYYKELEDCKLTSTDCFNKLAKSNPKIATYYFVNLTDSRRSDIEYDVEELPIADNFAVAANLIVRYGGRAIDAPDVSKFIEHEATHEQLEQLLGALGMKRMLEYCKHLPEKAEQVKAIAEPLVKSAAKLS